MYAQKRDANEDVIVELLTRIGCYVQRMDKSAGYDLLVMRDDIKWIMEVKMPGKKLTKAEEVRKDEIERIGNSKYHVIYSPEDALGVIESISFRTAVT